MTKPWHIYLIQCEDQSIYTGITVDVDARFQAHKAGKGARYTRSHKPICLLASRLVGSHSEALRIELAVKKLPKHKKIQALQSLAVPSTHHNERLKTMNKSELVEIIAAEADISKAAALTVLNSITGAVVKAVAKGDTVTLVGFGTFKSSKRAARVGKNPQTGAELKIPATTVPKFTVGATFKAAVAGKKAAKK
jgi:DNA-binding protein HU-beta